MNAAEVKRLAELYAREREGFARANRYRDRRLCTAGMDKAKAALHAAIDECCAGSEVIASTGTDDQPGKSGDTRFACDRSERRPQQSPTASDEVRELGNPLEPTEWMPKVPPLAPGEDQ